MGEKTPIPVDPQEIYDDPMNFGEHPQGVAINESISVGFMTSEEDFHDQVTNNEELKRRATVFEGFIGVTRGAPNRLKLYFAKELHHITGEGIKKAVIVGAGVAGTAATVFVLHHEIQREKKRRAEVNKE